MRWDFSSLWELRHRKPDFLWFLRRCMTLFSRRCPEATEVSNRTAESLILQLGMGDLVSPQWDGHCSGSWSSMVTGATSPGLGKKRTKKPYNLFHILEYKCLLGRQQAGLPPVGSSSSPGENLSSESGVWSIKQPSPTSSLCQAEF